MEYFSSEEFYWYGHMVGLDSCYCVDGEITLMARAGERFGIIRVDDIIYELEEMTGGLNALGKVDNDHYIGKSCGNTSLDENEASGLAEGIEYRNATCEIRLLVLYSPNAAEAVPNIMNTAQLAVNHANQALSNSGISTYEIDFKLAGVQEYTGFMENSLNIEQDIEQLSLDSIVAQWRTNYGADAVIMLTDGDYESGQIYGITAEEILANGSINSNRGNPQSHLAFAIVEIEAAINKLTFAHELGHILGSRHQQCNLFSVDGCDSEGDNEHGHGWGHRKCLSWHNYSTIMHQHRFDNTRLQRFSNPAISINGHPTGIEGIRDNTKWILDHACQVSEYTSYEYDFDLNISGSVFATNDQEVTYSANPQNGSLPFVYTWSLSTNGVNYSPTSETSAYFTTMMPQAPVPMVWIKVVATSSDGQVATAIHETELETHFHRITSSNQLTKDEVISIFPNPSSTQISIAFPLNGDQSTYLLNIYDQFGSLKKSIKKQVSKDNQNERVDVNDLISGIYSVNILTNTTILSTTFIKIK